MQTVIRLLVVFLAILSILPLALASTGCFFYENSPLHCQTVDETTAQEECSFFSTCLFPVVFFPGTSCEDKSAFPHCEKVLCKGTCTEEWRGECLQGKILEGEQPFWCSPGCCRFTSSDETHCTFESNAGICENAARNKQAEQFQFFSTASESDCTSACSNPNAGEELVSKVVSPLDLLSSPGENLLASVSFTSENDSSATGSGRELKINTLVVVLILGIIGAGSAVAFVYGFRKKLASTIPPRLSEERKSPSEPFSPFQSDPFIKGHIEKIHSEREHKKKEQEWEEYLTEFRLLGTPLPESNIEKLKTVVRRHKKKLAPPFEKKSESPWSKLRLFIAKK